MAPKEEMSQYLRAMGISHFGEHYREGGASASPDLPLVCWFEPFVSGSISAFGLRYPFRPRAI